jgi:hypothetical protein
MDAPVSVIPATAVCAGRRELSHRRKARRRTSGNVVRVYIRHVGGPPMPPMHDGRRSIPLHLYETRLPLIRRKR